MTRRMIAAALGAGLLVIAAVAAASLVLDIPAGTFTRDPAALAPGLPFYGGSVSLLSAVVWGVVGALSFFVAWAGGQRLRRPLILLGTFALILLTDDALMFHENLGARVGIPDEAWYALYAIVAGFCVWELRADLRRGHGVALLLGGALLALSVGVDTLDQESSAWLLLEDGAKLLGGLVWITVPVLAWAAGREPYGPADAATDDTRAPRPAEAAPART